METLILLLKWLFFETIYGIAAVSAIIYGLFWAVKRVVSKAPSPALMAVLIGLLGLVTVPSIPRYQFEQNAFAQIEGKRWIRVTDQMKWGDLMEPLTLIKAPVGFIKLVMPNDSITGGFKEAVLRYDEEPTVSLVDADCEDFTVWYSRPDNEGTFRYLTQLPQDMTETERETYCIYDWTLEREALRTEILRRIEKEEKGG